MKVSTILDQIDLGSMALPEFQRGYVWNREQVKGLVYSLYRRYPVGSLLVWVTQTEGATTRGSGPVSPGYVKLLLDGQQRITSLYGLVRGKPPAFFSGNEGAFRGLHFHVRDQLFEFYAPMKMKDDPHWVSVTEVLKKGAALVAQPYFHSSDPDAPNYLMRLNSLAQIADVDLHVEEVTGEDKTVDVVVDIFNRVNSGGTKLSKGDLALARVCASWPEARKEMRARLDRWRRAGFDFRLEWFLRCINAQETGQALFTALADVDIPRFQKALKRSEKDIDYLLNMIASRLGLDHSTVLGSAYAFPLMLRYLTQEGGRKLDHGGRDGLLFWYIHTFLWGRYSGSTETILAQDLNTIRDVDGGVERLIEALRRERGNLRLTADDFKGWSRAARFYPLLYMLTRVHGARDWDDGTILSRHLLGVQSQLHLHHIFPKAKLYKAGYGKAAVNAIANFTFLTASTNEMVSDRDPAEYVPQFIKKHPGVVESHWIPMDPALWKVENYHAFLDARRELLAGAANRFLDSLRGGTMPEQPEAPSVLDQVVTVPPGGTMDDAEQVLLSEVNAWAVAQGLAEGIVAYELVDPNTREPLAILDLAWPEGLQRRLSQPVALLIEEDGELGSIASRAGFRYFTDPEALKEYVRREILAEVDAKRTLI